MVVVVGGDRRGKKSHLLTALQFGFVVKNLPPLESDTGTSTVPETAIGLL